MTKGRIALGAMTASLALLGLVLYSSFTWTSPQFAAMQSYAISEAEPAGATVQTRVVFDGKSLLGEEQASISVNYSVNENSSREEVIAQLLEAAEADGWAMVEQEESDRLSWTGRRALNEGSSWIIFLGIVSSDDTSREVRLRLTSLYALEATD